MALFLPTPPSGHPALEGKSFYRTDVRSIGLWIAGLGLVLGGCASIPAISPRQIVVNQSWELESGDWVAGYLVTGSLGDVSVQLRGASLRAPFAGQVELAATGARCVYFSTPEIPAYLFRFCGVRRPRIGAIEPGQVIGHGEQVHFATLRRQPDGAWAIVEPSDSVLEQSLQPRFGH